MPLTEWRLRNMIYICIYIYGCLCTWDDPFENAIYMNALQWYMSASLWQGIYAIVTVLLYAGSRNSFVYPGADVICTMGVISWYHFMCQLQSIDIYWRICMSRNQLIVNAMWSCWFGLSFYPILLWCVISRLKDRGLKRIFKPLIKCYDFVNTFGNTIFNMYATLWQVQYAKFICD